MPPAIGAGNFRQVTFLYHCFPSHYMKNSGVAQTAVPRCQKLSGQRVTARMLYIVLSTASGSLYAVWKRSV